MRPGATKNSAGIGGQMEETSFGGFVTITGGSEEQRRYNRDYSKVAHALDAKERAAKLKAGLNDPFPDVSMPKRVL